MSTHRVVPLLVIATLFSSFIATSHAADGCDAVYQAGLKSVQTPHHMYITTTHGDERMRDSEKFRHLTGKPLYAGKTESSEAVFDGKAEYLQVHGKWRRSPVAQADMLAAAKEKLQTRPDSCTAKGEQSIDGQTVEVYAVRGNGSGSEQLVRISKSSGLLQGGSSTQSDGTVVNARYAYDDVHAPDGLR